MHAAINRARIRREFRPELNNDRRHSASGIPETRVICINNDKPRLRSNRPTEFEPFEMFELCICEHVKRDDAWELRTLLRLKASSQRRMRRFARGF